MYAATHTDDILLAAESDQNAPAGPAPRPEWRRALAWSLVILLAGSLPYLIAWFATPADHQFTGILVNPFDGHSYLAKLRQGLDGAWLFHLTYTPELHAGAAVYLFYLALGHLARLAGLPLIAVYHAARLVGGLALLMTLYAFVCRLSPVPRTRRVLFLLAGATAGLGWLGSLLGLFPIDLWVPEAFAFFSLLTNPHFPLALALLLAIVYGVVWPARGAWCWLLPGLAGTALGMVAPFALAPLYVTLVLYVLLLAWLGRRTRETSRARAGGTSPEVRPVLYATAGAVLASAPWLVYDAWVFTTNPAFAAWSAQNVTLTPSLLNLALGCGLLVPPAIVGAVVAIRRRERPTLMLVLWAGVTLVLLHVPVALQRRMITGLGLPVALLAGVGLTQWLPGRLSDRRVYQLSGLVLTLGVLGSAFLLAVFPAGALGKAAATDETALYYLSDDEVAGMQWLDANARGAVVLAAPRTSTILPGQAGVRVFYGHPFETIDAAAKKAQAEAFFGDRMSDAEWRRMVATYAIRYVFVGPGELGERGAVRLPDPLEPVFQRGEVTIYRVP